MAPPAAAALELRRIETQAHLARSLSRLLRRYKYIYITYVSLNLVAEKETNDEEVVCLFVCL